MESRDLSIPWSSSHVATADARFCDSTAFAGLSAASLLYASTLIFQPG